MRIELNKKLRLKIAAAIALTAVVLGAHLYFAATKAEILWSFRPSRPATAAVGLSADLVFLGAETALYALDKHTGEVKWRFKCESVHSRPLAANGLVYFAALSGRLYAVDLATGVEKWRYDGARGYQFNPSMEVAIEGTTVIAPGPRSIVGLDAVTGKQLWETPAQVMSHIVSAGDTVCFVAARRDDNIKSVHAIETQSRQEKWIWVGAGAGEKVSKFAPACITGALVWFWQPPQDSSGPSIRAIDLQSGRQRLSVSASQRPLMPVTAIGHTMLVAGAGEVVAVHAESGQELWYFKTPGPLVAPVGVDANRGRAIAVSERSISVLDAAGGEEVLTVDMIEPAPFLPIADDGIIYALDARGLRAMR